jgi:cytoskeleton protein RodZ
VARTSCGEKLRRERESRNIAIEEMAERTEIDARYLLALEQDDLDALPGLAIGKFYIRVYGEVLGFDPEPLIAEFDREVGRRESSREGEAPREPARPRRVAAAIERWRAEKLAERQASTTVDLAEPAESPPDPEPERPEAEPVEVEAPVGPLPESVAAEPPCEAPAPPSGEDEQPAHVTPHGSPHDESAAMASILGPPAAGAARRPRRLLLLTMVAMLLVVLLLVWWVGSASPDEVAVSAPPAATPAAPVRQSDRGGAEDPAQVEIETADAEPKGAKPNGAQSDDAKPSVGSPPPPTVADPPRGTTGARETTRRLSVVDFGVGRAVVDLRLEQPAERFEEGSVAWFLTRVEGGRRGDPIRHVWLHQGRPVQSIRLELGGPNWRTYSSKTLWGAGEWAVEARDADGRVLARAAFRCVPRSP